jgi:hypothetical protein
MNARNNDHHFTQYFHLNPLTFPSYYSPQILPKEHKEKVTKKLLEYAEYLTATYNVNSAPLVSLVDLMNAHDNTAELPLMREWTTKLDKLRNQNSKETFPFLAEIFDNDIPTA